jgi:hypothetical protein
MNARRFLKHLCIIVSNGTLFYFAMRNLLNPHELLYWRIFAVVVCAGLIGGVVLEIRNQRVARIVNVAVPAGVGVILASSIVWLPMLARVQQWEHPTDAAEGSPFLLVFSLVPFFLACVAELTYRILDDIDSNKGPTTLA